MHFKHLSLLALASLATAQNNGTNSTGDLNSTLASQPTLSNLTTFLSLNQDLLTSLNGATNLTLLAPSDEAFATLLNSSGDANANPFAVDPGLLQALLQYHVLNGTFFASSITENSTFVPTLLTNSSYTNVTGGQVVEAVMIGESVVFYGGLLGNATVTQPDLNFTGGTIHIIDNVLMFPVDVLTTANAANLTAAYGAINATDLEDVVTETPDITIFVPTNEAFQSVYSALQNLSDDDLERILAYHVVNGTVGYSTTLENGTSLQTAEGGNLTITIVNGTVFVNSAEVLIPNVLVANGVVHVIDNVLNPSETTGPSSNATEGAPAYSATGSATDVPFTSGQPTPSTRIAASSAGPGAASSAVASSSSKAAAWMPLETGAYGVAGKAALFGIAAGAFFG